MAHFFLLCNVLIVKCLTLFPDPYVEQILTENSCVFLQKVLTFCHPPQINLHSQCFYKTPSQGCEISVSFHRCTEKVLEKNLSSQCIARNIKTHRRCRTKTVLIFVYIPWNFTLACLRFFFYAIIINSNRAILTISLHNTKQLIYMLCCILSN